MNDMSASLMASLGRMPEPAPSCVFASVPAMLFLQSVHCLSMQELRCAEAIAGATVGAGLGQG